MDRKKPLKLQTMLSLLVIAVVFVSITIIISFVASWMTRNIEKEAKTNVMNVAELVAHSSEVIDALEKKDTQVIASYVDMQLKNLELIDYITVADNQGIRYSHPNPQMIGKAFEGGDEYRVVRLGETYVSEATGTLGKSLRAFAPIYDEHNQEIGFVSVGTLITRIEKAKHMAVFYIMLIGFGGLSAGSVGAFLLANHIKKMLLGLEPDEIAKLYHEKMGILDAIHEGLVAIDREGRITLMNDSALQILGFDKDEMKHQVIGRNIEDIIPNTRMTNILSTKKAEFDDEQRLHDTLIVTNRIPIMNRGQVIGVIASFRDKTEVTKLAEELTGVKKLAWSLRAQNHEFMNKLHTIAGLIQLEEYEEALQFISDVARIRTEMSHILTDHIKDSAVSALLLSKYNKAEECRIKLTIDESSRLNKLPWGMNSQDLGSVIGNLIENSLDEVKNDGTGRIDIRIVEEKEYLTIRVKDNGEGIMPELREKIFEQGFSTKEGQRGYGLSIVKKIIEEYGGAIHLTSEEGVQWDITIPMERREELDWSHDCGR
ncbi:sensor histidine kinase [Lacrimispora sp.]|uniref:sensor histidine kinase n=1 Tax=Lacrimispora sp. TaxID=2719234 RepID=UPI0028AFF44D|nr:sensor histidine kinase [Lacrimispora sp.]